METTPVRCSRDKYDSKGPFITLEETTRSHGNDVSTAQEISKQKFIGTPIIVYSAYCKTAFKAAIR